MALRPTGNTQGGFKFYSLKIGEILTHNRCTPMPMPSEVMDRIKHLARQDPDGITFRDRNGAILEDDDDDNDTSYEPIEEDDDCRDDLNYPDRANDFVPELPGVTDNNHVPDLIARTRNNEDGDDDTDNEDDEDDSNYNTNDNSE